MSRQKPRRSKLEELWKNDLILLLIFFFFMTGENGGLKRKMALGAVYIWGALKVRCQREDLALQCLT